MSSHRRPRFIPTTSLPTLLLLTALFLLATLQATSAWAQSNGNGTNRNSTDGVIKTTNSKGQTIYWTKEADPGFPGNRSSSPWGSENARFDSAWRPLGHLPYMLFRGEDIHGQPQLAFSSNQHAHAFFLSTADGRPLRDYRVRLHQPGHDDTLALLQPTLNGVTVTRLLQPTRTHHLVVDADGYRSYVLELTGGKLVSGKHQIRLQPLENKNTPVVERWTPEKASKPPKDAIRAYRDGRRAAAEERWDDAAQHLYLALARWPLSGTQVKVRGERETYRPQLYLAEALARSGENDRAGGILADLARDESSMSAAERELLASLDGR